MTEVLGYLGPCKHVDAPGGWVNAPAFDLNMIYEFYHFDSQVCDQGSGFHVFVQT